MNKIRSGIVRKFAIISCSVLLLFASCEGILEEKVFIETMSAKIFQNDQDAIAAVNAIYAKMRADGSATADAGQREGWGGFGYGEAKIFNYSQVQTDEILVRWSGFSQSVNFTLTPSGYSNFESVFSDLFEGIFIANNVLINVNDNANITETIRNRVKGEALFRRALFYSKALSLFGNLPKITSPESDPFNLPTQVPPEEIAQLLINDLAEAASLLPETYANTDYGRFTKGAAYALLARFQLNQKNWQAAINASREVIGSGYSLSTNYGSIFGVDNQGNPEIILIIPCIAQPGVGNTMIAHTAEPDFIPGGWGGHLARNEFYDSFDQQDFRRTFLVRNYQSVTGGMRSVTDGAMIIKYQPDPNRVGAWAGNDIVLHRLGEVYLTLAEALNEENGPNQESIDLINALRDRAFGGDVSKRIQLADFSSTEKLRNHILNERSWELYAENYRREDLIRHGKYIQQALDRGVVNAQEFHVLYPIPQTEIDRNPNLNQNPGYL